MCLKNPDIEYYCKVLNRFLPITNFKETMKWRICVRIVAFYDTESEVICIYENFDKKFSIEYKVIPFSLIWKYNEYRSISGEPIKMIEALMENTSGLVECTITDVEYKGVRSFGRKFKKLKYFDNSNIYYNPHATEYEIWVESYNNKPFYMFTIDQGEEIVKLIKKLQKKIHKIRLTGACP